MDNLDEILETIICNLYSKIIYSEERILKDMIGDTLTLKEFHTLDVVFNCQAKGNNTAGNIAKLLGITLGTCTINIDRLCTKGYLSKVKDDRDRRITYIKLTNEGNALRQKHDNMHKKVVRQAIKGLSSSEKVALISLSGKLDI